MALPSPWSSARLCAPHREHAMTPTETRAVVEAVVEPLLGRPLGTAVEDVSGGAGGIQVRLVLPFPVGGYGPPTQARIAEALRARGHDGPVEVVLRAAVGAHAAYAGPLIVVDSGTATNFDVIAADGAFEGGVIAPGINLSMQALHQAAARLPRVAIQRPKCVIGRDTVTAMQSGVFWGYMALIEGMIDRIREEYGADMTVVATGGVASLFEGATDKIDIFDPDVTIRGMLEVWRRNQGITS